MGEVASSFISGGTPNTSNNSFWNGNIPWLQSSDLYEDILFNPLARKFISILGLKNSSAKLIAKNSIAIITRVGVGKLAVVPYTFTTSQDFLSFSDLKIDLNFAVYALSKLMKLEAQSTQGTSIKGVTKDVLLERSIKYPQSKEEQTAIGNFFKQLDDTIALHRRNYIKIQNVKAAYLEYIFSSKFIQNKSKNTNAWEQRKLGEVATFLNGRAYKQDELLSKGKYPVLRVGNFNTNDRWYFSDLELPSKFYADNGDLLYTWATIFFTTYLEWKKGYLSLPYMESRSFGEIR
ncbi:hypothetical protein CFY87_06755 [Actinobacillus seminis]|uniref:Type I restriction modification DNA specificity domain-containing protein n=1 Tax=Actinobacillus seminis TaxID=722 RepID=A0ABX4FMP6_9PAST|nr:hypothetical protein CFY87_06755 [Actinobacillus seminis]